MTVRCRSVVRLFGIGLALALTGFSLWAGEPTDRIQTAVDRGLQVVNDPRFQSEDKKDERNSRLREIIYSLFDFSEMAKRSLGTHWRKLSPQQRQTFVPIFTDFLEKIYADRVDLYNGERALFLREVVDGDYAEVYSKIVSKKRAEAAVVYKMHRVDGRWKVYDVIVENISLVNNYRAQFSRLMANSSFEELIRRMKEKTG
jgi:phospholipid transport system substrate-binding protein